MNRPFRPDDGALSGPQHCWRVAQTEFAGEPFTIAQLYGLTNGVARKTVQDIVLRWMSDGHVEVVQKQTGHDARGRFLPTTYRIASKDRYAPVRRRPTYAADRGRRYQQLWTTMRTLPQFGIPELAYAASTDELHVGYDVARAYVGHLLKAGILIALIPYSKGTKGPFGRGARAGLYRLKPSANTGPKAVRIMKGGVPFDPNVQQPEKPVKRTRARRTQP